MKEALLFKNIYIYEKNWDVEKHTGDMKWLDLISKAMVLKPEE